MTITIKSPKDTNTSMGCKISVLTGGTTVIFKSEKLNLRPN